ncbi:MAG: pyrroline-5-carboxylate reductase [Acidiferrobacter sp.]
MQNPFIGIVGAGNMGLALAAGLADVHGHALLLCDRQADKRAAAAERGLRTTADIGALTGAAIIILAVKPPQMAASCQALGQTLGAHRPLIVSVAAGIRLANLDHWLGHGLAVVRAMPNTPALINAGATVLCANPRVDADGRALAETVLRAVSRVWWLADEALMDAVTAVSGSGPAYVFLLIEALAAAATGCGLPPSLARDLVNETVLGAARMAAQGAEEVTTLRRRVTSPGGTTERAVQSLLDHGFMAMFETAIAVAVARADELGQEQGMS